MTTPDLALVLVGFGRVGRRFVHLLTEIAERLDFDWRVAAIATRHHGSVVDPAGIDVARASALVDANHSLDRLEAEPRERSGIDVIRQSAQALADEAAEGRLVCIESTVLDIDRGEPALSHVRAALEAQMHVVTVNKGPAAFAYHELESLAEAVDRVFFFEGAVMDGVPVFNLVREMQARGIAEADPSLDIDGWDAAAKTAVLVNVLMAGAITPHKVARTGIKEVKTADLVDAIARGRRIRLVASAARQGGVITARVEPEMLAARDPLATLEDTENALYLITDLLGEIGIVQREGTLTQTAYALVSDLSRISLRLREWDAR